MAGNTVYVKGNYVDIHDNQEVNLNIEKAEVQVDNATILPESADTTKKEETPSDKQKGGNKDKGGRPKRAGQSINKAFTYDAGTQTNVRLQLFYKGTIYLLTQSTSMLGVLLLL